MDAPYVLLTVTSVGSFRPVVPARPEDGNAARRPFDVGRRSDWTALAADIAVGWVRQSASARFNCRVDRPPCFPKVPEMGIPRTVGFPSFRPPL